MDHTVVWRTDSVDVSFIGSDATVESHALECRRAVERANRIVRAQAQRADRGSAFEEIVSREGIRLGVDDQIDLTLAIERHAL